MLITLEQRQQAFRAYRSRMLQAFDLWEKAVLRGREEDSTEVMAWYQQMLEFPETITADTTYKEYPPLPERIKHYL